MGIAILSNLISSRETMSEELMFPNGKHQALEEDQSGMLSEMFNFPANRSGGMGDDDSNSIAQIAGINAMQLYLMKPQPQPQVQNTSSCQGLDHVMNNHWMDNPSQGLSLSLSSSLQAKVDGGIQPVGAGSSSSCYNRSVQHVGLGSVNVVRSSKYVKAAQQLLEELCSVGRGHFINNRISRNTAASSSCSLLPLSAADRIDHQRRKLKLLSMLDQVDRRYSHYCEQMQMVVNSLDVVMGLGAAVPYTALAQKAMSRHFRCLKDAVAAQLKQSCEVLGDKETKGETPRLKLLEQSLRQQHQMDHQAWRPQRGLPDRSVNILRAWLFEHFLHPYPSDADKHLLARQTGLSRNQVSNWFINARVRLWKPMVEDMYQQEAKEEDDAEPTGEQRSETPTTTSDPSLDAINTRQSCFSENQAFDHALSFPAVQDTAHYGTSSATPPLRVGTPAAGDVSLTLGLRHAGNVLPPSQNPAPFSVMDFGG